MSPRHDNRHTLITEVAPRYHCGVSGMIFRMGGNLANAIDGLKPKDHLCLIYQVPDEHLSAAATY